MDGEPNRNNLRYSDGYLYHRHGADAKNAKLYFKCIKYRWGGCRVNIQTNNTDKTIDHQRVFHKNGLNNHVLCHDYLKRTQRLSYIKNNTSKYDNQHP